MAKAKTKSANELVEEQVKESTLQVVNKFLNMEYLPKTREEFRAAVTKMDQFSNRMNGLIGWKKGQMLSHLKHSNKYGSSLIEEEAKALGESPQTLYKLITIFETHPADDKEAISRLKLLSISKAKSVATIADEKTRIDLENAIIEENLPVREVDRRVQEIKKKTAAAKNKKNVPKKAPVLKADTISNRVLTSFKRCVEDLEGPMALVPSMRTLCSDDEATSDEQFAAVVENLKEAERLVIQVQQYCKQFVSGKEFVDSLIL